MVQNLHDRLIIIETVLNELQNKASQVVQAQEDQETSVMESAEFALFWVLKYQRVKDAEGSARQAHTIVDQHLGWQYNSKQEAPSHGRICSPGILAHSPDISLHLILSRQDDILQRPDILLAPVFRL